jgi:hypothetical protein
MTGQNAPMKMLVRPAMLKPADKSGKAERRDIGRDDDTGRTGMRSTAFADDIGCVHCAARNRDSDVVFVRLFGLRNLRDCRREQA